MRELSSRGKQPKDGPRSLLGPCARGGSQLGWIKETEKSEMSARSVPQRKLYRLSVETDLCDIIVKNGCTNAMRALSTIFVSEGFHEKQEAGGS